MRLRNTKAEIVNAGDWVCEAVLWTMWVHHGDLRAHKECQMITIDGHKFSQLMRKNNILWIQLHKYAAAFVAELNKISAETLTDLLTGGRDDALIDPHDILLRHAILPKAGFLKQTSGKN